MSSLKTLVKTSVPTKYVPALTEVYFSLRSVLYAGDQFTCPCCNEHFRKFLPYGGENPQQNSQCPRCGSAERHRLIWLYLKNKTNFFSANLKVLDIAPIYWFQKIFRSLPNLDYISADLVDPLAMVEMDITNISYEDNYFDVILCSHVLEHIMQEQKAMTELLRVLKPGGWAILQVPLDIRLAQTFEDPNIVLPEEREHFFGQYDHVRLYGRDFKDRLEKAGFTVKVDNYVKDLGIDVVNQYKLEEDENRYISKDIYLCTKDKRFCQNP